MVSEDDLREIAEEDKPLKGGPGKRQSKTRKGKGSMKGAMVMVLGQASAALFTCVAMATGHDHWSLEREEASRLGEVLDKALATLPERAYEKVIEISEKWAPWVQLIFVLGILLWDRVETSAKLVEEQNYKQSNGGFDGSSGSGRGAEKAHRQPHHSSLGYDAGRADYRPSENGAG